MAKKTVPTTPKPAAVARLTVPETFRFKAPNATSVLLAGDFTHWQKAAIPMKKKPGGVWEITVTLASGTYHYRFMVDGVWQDDPECTLRVPGPFGAQNCVRGVA